MVYSWCTRNRGQQGTTQTFVRAQSNVFLLMALPCIIVATLSTIPTQHAYARHQLSDDPQAPCYEAIGFNANMAFVKGKSAYFRHIWGHSAEHPYFRYLGGGFIGVRGTASGDSERDTKWRNAGGDSHGFSVLDLRYWGTFGRGVSVGFDSQSQIAFLFYPRRPEKKHFTTFSPIPRLLARDLDKMPAATTVEGKIGYIEKGGASAYVSGTRRHQRSAARLLKIRARTFPKNAFRTLHRKQRRLQVGGKTVTETILCRYGFWPLAATNHDKFKPFIERELIKWVNKPSGDSLVHVVAIPKSHVGDFRKSTQFGEVRISFTKDPYSKDIYYTEKKEWSRDGSRYGTGIYAFYIKGRLHVRGRYLGIPVDAYMGTYRRCCSKDTKSLKYQKFNMRWKNVSTKNYRIECDSSVCKLFVVRKLLGM